VGYAAGGPVGALAMTAGIFLPAFSFLAAAVRSPRGRGGPQAPAGFLEGVAAGVVGLIAATTLELGAARRRSPAEPGSRLLIFAAACGALSVESRLAVPA
jgi:chromate transporter